MPAKIRLQRHGKKGRPYFHIVVADARAPRDGRYIERLGFYNPNTNPATIDLDIDGAVKWLGNGAQPTDTARAILSYKGVLYKNHLLKGVEKGAFSEEEAEKRFASWLEEKQAKIEAKRKGLADKAAQEQADRLKAEADVSKARAAELAAAAAPPVEDSSAEAETTEEAAVEATTEAAPETEASAEAPAEAKAEEPAKEEAKEEKAEEAAKEEPKAEEAPAEATTADEKNEDTAAEAKEEDKPKAEVKAEKTSTPEPTPEADPIEVKAEEAKKEEETKAEAKEEDTEKKEEKESKEDK